MEEQCGCRSGRSTADMMFVVPSLQKIGRKEEASLLIRFIDLQRAYGIVDRTFLWPVFTRIMEYHHR